MALEDVTPEMAEAREKLRARIGTISRVGGARVNRRKPPPGAAAAKAGPAAAASAAGEDRKLMLALKKLGMSTISGMDDAAIFRSADEDALVFSHPRVRALVNANTFVISNAAGEPPARKPAAEVMQSQQQVPMTLDQDTLLKIATEMQRLQNAKATDKPAGGAQPANDDDDEEEAPELVMPGDGAADAQAKTATAVSAADAATEAPAPAEPETAADAQ